MRSLIFLVFILSSFIFLSCDPYDFQLPICNENITCPDGRLWNDFEEEKDRLDLNWRKVHDAFKYAKVYKDDVIFFGARLKSINRQSGILNWFITFEFGWPEANVHFVIHESKLYFIEANKLHVVDLDQGILLHEIDWVENENLNKEIRIKDDIIYLTFNESSNKYSSFVFCPVDELASNNWTLYNRKEQEVGDENYESYTIIEGHTIEKNELGQRISYSTNKFVNTSSSFENTINIEAFNINTNNLEWTIELDSLLNVSGNIRMFKDQLIVEADDVFISININTGEELWRQENIDWNGLFMVYNNRLIVFDNHLLSAYNLDSNGSLLWRARGANSSTENVKALDLRTLNVIDDVLFALTKEGRLLEANLELGTYIVHHDLLSFDNDLIVTKEREVITVTKHADREFISYNLN